MENESPSEAPAGNSSSAFTKLAVAPVNKMFHKSLFQTSMLGLCVQDPNAPPHCCWAGEAGAGLLAASICADISFSYKMSSAAFASDSFQVFGGSRH